ncbi:hypothetical protein LR48_Vigan01g080500 [Vigna angularis]|uniref:Uncharacterized protein n=1 Tax=Phaseolus angularis TaxID=3914 RepID=A0A0L9TL24_PHAAN|nr:hypothetical protein LR48_Vigan01g080500 [Vigna angularis]
MPSLRLYVCGSMNSSPPPYDYRARTQGRDRRKQSLQLSKRSKAKNDLGKEKFLNEKKERRRRRALILPSVLPSKAFFLPSLMLRVSGSSLPFGSVSPRPFGSDYPLPFDSDYPLPFGFDYPLQFGSSSPLPFGFGPRLKVAQRNEMMKENGGAHQVFDEWFRGGLCSKGKQQRLFSPIRSGSATENQGRLGSLSPAGDLVHGVGLEDEAALGAEDIVGGVVWDEAALGADNVAGGVVGDEATLGADDVASGVVGDEAALRADDAAGGVVGNEAGRHEKEGTQSH